MNKYKKFGKASKGLIFINSIMITNDHFLYVEQVGYTERYYRYFYKDLKYAIAYKNKSNKKVIFWLIAGSVAMLLISIITKQYFSGFSIISVITISLLLLYLAIKRPAGNVVIATQTGEYKLNMGTFKKAVKLLKLIKTKAEEIQGPTTPAPDEQQ